MKLAIFGSSGFVGSNFIHNYPNFEYILYDRADIKNFKFTLNDGIYAVINFTGKAHDLKNKTDYDAYYEINTKFSSDLFDKFVLSEAKVFITISSVKAAAYSVENILTEEFPPNPVGSYGISKMLAEKHIINSKIPSSKRVYILRPCMIHGKGNKGNLNLLHRYVRAGFPWPLTKFENKRSICNIENLNFVINQLIQNEKIQSGIYNVADDDPISTNDIIKLIALSLKKNVTFWNISKSIIRIFCIIGDVFNLPINTNQLNKLTENYIVSNSKIVKAMKKNLPLSTHEGLLNTFNNYNIKDK